MHPRHHRLGGVVAAISELIDVPKRSIFGLTVAGEQLAKNARSKFDPQMGLPHRTCSNAAPLIYGPSPTGS